MSSREERSALESLQKLIEQDLSQLDNETLIEGVRDAELTFDKSQEWSGRMVAELKARLSWSELVRLTGVPQTTLVRRARPFLPPDSPAAGTE